MEYVNFHTLNQKTECYRLLFTSFFQVNFSHEFKKARELLGAYYVL